MSNNRDVVNHLTEMFSKFTTYSDNRISRQDFKEFEKYSIGYIKKELSVTRDAAQKDFTWFTHKLNVTIID
jgi:Ca2+-binding EF-hand superfamily protein